jgi:hypothetical protein
VDFAELRPEDVPISPHLFSELISGINFNVEIALIGRSHLEDSLFSSQCESFF